VEQLSSLRWPAAVASLLIVPVVHDGQVWSAIEVVSERLRQVGDWDVALVRTSPTASRRWWRERTGGGVLKALRVLHLGARGRLAPMMTVSSSARGPRRSVAESSAPTAPPPARLPNRRAMFSHARSTCLPASCGQVSVAAPARPAPRVPGTVRPVGLRPPAARADRRGPHRPELLSRKMFGGPGDQQVKFCCAGAASIDPVLSATVAR
jgi:hypothetical protein